MLLDRARKIPSSTSLSVQSPSCVCKSTSLAGEKSTSINITSNTPAAAPFSFGVNAPAAATVASTPTTSASIFAGLAAYSGSKPATSTATTSGIGGGSTPESSKPVAAPKEDFRSPGFFNFGVKKTDAGAGSGQANVSAGSEAAKAPAPAGFNFSFGKTLETQDTLLLFGTPPASADSSGLLGNLFANTGKPPGASVEQPAPSVGAASEQSGSTGASGNDEEDAPPVVEIVDSVEEGAVFTKRCKLFFMKDGSFVEKGLGNVHLVKKDGDTKQIVMRAGTTLGNVLLNIAPSSDMPMERVGKNNVRFVCVPNPPLNPKEPSTSPVTMLFRVKTGAEADQLLDEMKKFSGKTD